jgi:protein tyrosine/serine phosphatase
MQVLGTRRMDETTLKVPFPNSYWVVPNQFLAGEHPGDANEEITRKRLSALLDVDIRTIVDLTDEDEINEDAKPVPGYRTLLRTIAEERRVEVTYMRVPISDRGVPSVWTLRHILDVIDRSVSDENSVFVHCWAGRGRTGTVVGCHLMRHGRANDRDVIQMIADLRRLMPAGRDSSPHTPEQIRMVKTWKEGA